MKTHTNHTELWHKTSMYLAWSLVWKNSSKSKNIMEKEEGIKSHEIKKLSQIHTKTWWNWLAYNTNSSAAASVCGKKLGSQIELPAVFYAFFEQRREIQSCSQFRSINWVIPPSFKKIQHIHNNSVKPATFNIWHTSTSVYSKPPILVNKDWKTTTAY